MGKYRNALDQLVKDACIQQTRLGLSPQPLASHDELRPVVERLEQKNAEAARRPVSVPPPRKQKPVEQIEAAYKKAGGVGTHVQLIRGDETTPVARRKQSRDQRLDEKRRRRRLRLLWSKDDWRLRLMNVDILACQGLRGPEAKRQADAEYAAILADSERVFGPYWKDRSKTLYATGSGKRGTVQS